MAYLKHLVIITIICLSCNNTPQKPIKTQPTMPGLAQDANTFVAYWNQHYNATQEPLLAIFRTRYFTATDRKELDKYLKRNKIKANFTHALTEIKSRSEYAADTLLTGVKWVSNTDVETCNKVDPDFWPCFNRRYTTPAFYYLSVPLFSADSMYCLLHVNYIHRTKGKSYGGGRLYHKTQKGWDEVAFLSLWGKLPN